MRNDVMSVIQVNTGNGCHLDAEMIHSAVKELDPPSSSLLLVENVGNLVCPALFDLGENARVLIISVTEGEDKHWAHPTLAGGRLYIRHGDALIAYNVSGK